MSIEKLKAEIKALSEFDEKATIEAYSQQPQNLYDLASWMKAARWNHTTKTQNLASQLLECVEAFEKILDEVGTSTLTNKIVVGTLNKLAKGAE